MKGQWDASCNSWSPGVPEPDSVKFKDDGSQASPAATQWWEKTTEHGIPQSGALPPTLGFWLMSLGGKLSSSKQKASKWNLSLTCFSVADAIC